MKLTAYLHHITHLLTEWRRVLASNDFDAVVVYAGSNTTYFADDQQPPFHAFGHFLRWVPERACEHAVLLITTEQQPILYWHKPTDYWYLAPSAPDYANEVFDVRTYDNLDRLHDSLISATGKYSSVAWLGHGPVGCEPTRLTQKLQRQLDYQRAFKTEFELECMAQATKHGTLGHLAAAKAFHNGASELQIHLTYLSACEHSESELPYPNIVALNEHAATLHYQNYDREPPEFIYSLLIDAGGSSNCYAADITRTYAGHNNDEFAELIYEVDAAQQAVINDISVGKPFLNLHELMHQRVAEILCRLHFLSCTAGSAIELRMTDAFFPHGLGHLLGLQTHDVGGHAGDPNGHLLAPHERHSSLRLLRTIQPGMVFTIEPGIYFIPSLLDSWRSHRDFNWPQIDRFMKYGGVRIEDNVYVTNAATTNMTRDALNELTANVAEAPLAT